MTREQEAVVRDALEQAGLSPAQVDRAVRAAKMDPAEVVERLYNLPVDDIEMAHVEADKVLLECIGEPDITEAFELVPRWYA